MTFRSSRAAASVYLARRRPSAAQLPRCSQYWYIGHTSSTHVDASIVWMTSMSSRQNRSAVPALVTFLAPGSVSSPFMV